MPDPFARIREALDENLFVGAGAGTGKTKALVDRLVALVASGLPITEIVAITFTEKAAAEMKERVRGELETMRAQADPGGRLERALNSLDAAPISTIHAFAGGLVRSFAPEAGVDPDYGVIDEVAAGRRFQQRWRERLEHLGTDDDARAAFARVLRLGLLPANIETLAFDLWLRPDIAGLALHFQPPDATHWPDLAAWRDQLRSVPIDEKPADDPLAMRLRKVLDLLELLLAASDDEREALLTASGIAGLKFNVSNQAVWGPRKREFSALGEEIRDALAEVLAVLREHALQAILPWIGQYVLDERAARCREGALTFDDLISITRDLVTANAQVRERLRRRYRCFLIDEFQDTDPWQFDIARAFATDPATGAIEPGRLFLVGDPKQSIYRFRNADMTIYNDARSAMVRTGEEVHLDQSWRSLPALVDWVNAVFAKLFPGDDLAVSPAYHNMSAVRGEQPDGHQVAVMGGVLDLKAAETRRAEALHVAATCQAVVRDGWHVFDRPAKGPRPARYGDIAILIPARTSLPDLERALEPAGIPFRVESGSLVFQTQELRDLINILAAVDEPADTIAVVGALRSPALACSDAELARHKLDGGTFNYLSPANPPGPVTGALARLRTFHEARPTTSVADLVQVILGETGIVASGLFDRGDRDAFRRARFVVEAARTFESDGPQPLRAFVDWLEERSARPLVDHEGAALDDDEDAVRILTVHGAKGLEFPVVIMASFGTNPRPPSAPTYAIEPAAGRLAVSVGSRTRGSQFTAGPVDAVLARERLHAQAELVRLLYVAATRARDHLIVSLYRSGRSTTSGVARLESADAASGIAILPAAAADVAAAPPRLAGVTVELPAAFDPAAAAAKRAALIEAVPRLRVTSATALAGRKEGRADDSEPWSTGRGGTRLGRAVHAVLQSVPLDAEPATVVAFARAQAVAEAIPDREGDVVRLATRGLQSGAMHRARTAKRALREVPFAIAVDGTIVEGFVDLLIETDGGLEIVDWKTDDIPAAEVDRRMEQYRLQAGLYVLGLERATGRRVENVTYVFVSAGVEHDLGDAAGLKQAALGAIIASTA
jgi:ATP-dependent exoDNAse (exonuclease V) beta subunit